MEETQYVIDKNKKQALILLLSVTYFFFSFIEIIAEFLEDDFLIRCTKPLLMPLLILLYAYASKKKNIVYMLSLGFVWIGTILFISKTFEFILFGTVFFTIFRILITYQILRTVRLPSGGPMVIACLPFLIIYLLVMVLTYDQLGENFYAFAVQGIFMIVFGGVALGGYFLNPCKSNTYLLICMMFFTCTQFLFVIRQFYFSINIFQTALMILFVIAHFLLYKFMIASENQD